MQNISRYTGYQRDVFRDWIEYAYLCLKALPRHLRSAQEHGTLAEDDQETKEFFERLNKDYSVMLPNCPLSFRLYLL